MVFVGFPFFLILLDCNMPSRDKPQNQISHRLRRMTRIRPYKKSRLFFRFDPSHPRSSLAPLIPLPSLPPPPLRNPPTLPPPPLFPHPPTPPHPLYPPSLPH